MSRKEEIDEEYLQNFYDELLSFREHLDEDLKRKLYLTCIEHVNSYNLLLARIEKLHPEISYPKIDPSIYELSRKEEDEIIAKGLFDQYYGSVLSTIAYRVDYWILHVRRMLHVRSLKFVPDSVYSTLPAPIRKMIDEATGCYEHSYLTACAIMLRKILEDSIYLKFSMEGKLDQLYKNGTRIGLDEMIQKAKELHYVSSQHASRLAKVKLFGDAGAHSFKIRLWDEDIGPCIDLIRLVLNELFYKASL
jgi:hypothetical protein